jgi:hypothetical protein
MLRRFQYLTLYCNSELLPIELHVTLDRKKLLNNRQELVLVYEFIQFNSVETGKSGLIS